MLPPGVRGDHRNKVRMHEKEPQYQASSDKMQMNRETLMKFIPANADLVQAETLQGVIYNQDTEITKALEQIHQQSIKNRVQQPSKTHLPHLDVREKASLSFAEMVQKPQVLNSSESFVQSRQHYRESRSKSNHVSLSSRKVFFTNLPEDVQNTEIWRTFKRFGLILDISIPKRKDRFGQIFGFIEAKNNLEARRIISKSGEIKFKGVPVKLDWQTEKETSV